jgi:oligopeptide/dipeptide ABC transporter ATP-binding protein
MFNVTFIRGNERKMNILVEVKALKKYFPITGGILKRKIGEVKAVDSVNLSIFKNECFGLVGESGCGKTTLAKTIVRLLRPNAGHIYFDVPEEIRQRIADLEKNNENSDELRRLREKYDLATIEGKKLRLMRRRMQIVYQDPTRSLNPRMLVKDIVGEPLLAQRLARGEDLRKKVIEMLYKVGLTERHMYRYPHEFSGGQRQRIAIARALVTNPDFVVLDEPTSSVDVSVRAQLLNLFQDLRKELGLTYLFISHDLSVIECIADRVAVMYLGKIVEVAKTIDLYQNPLHPYSTALFSSIPIPDPTVKREKIELKGEVPSPVDPPKGCRFHPRCTYAMDICREREPEFVNMGNDHIVACHLFFK